GVALFDAQGQLQAINRSGQFQFGLPLDQDVLSARRIPFEDIFDESWAAFKQRGLASDMLFPLRLRNGARLFARASSVQS
ncbi:hypothetical protein, partial [Staphylococcus aureus]